MDISVGWTIEKSSSVGSAKIIADSKEKHTGRYSLLIEATEPNSITLISEKLNLEIT